jgi:ribosomal protein S18
MKPDPRKMKVCIFCADKVILIDFKDAQQLRRYLTDRGKPGAGDREDSATEMMTADGHAARQGTGKGATVG